MADDDTLSAVLIEFAHTLATDFPIQRILDRLVERITDVLPITAAGVTLISPGSAPHYLAASDDAALRFERLQTEIGEGPCITAFETGIAVAIPDLRLADGYPGFAPAAVAEGLLAVFTFPLCHSEGRLGALDLYRDTAGDLDREDLATAQTLADVAAAYLMNAQAKDDARALSDQFRHSALHDSLTGLPNRLLLEERIEDLNAGSDVEVLAGRLDGLFSEPFHLAESDLLISITASIGLAFAGPGEEISTGLVAEADRAMYQVKRRGGAGHKIIGVPHSPRTALRPQVGPKVGFEHELRRALDTETLGLVYQPIVRSSDALLVGAEALLRWDHPVRGAVPALTIVGMAEQSDLIEELGAWVLLRACRDRAERLRERPGARFDLSVNVSGRQLHSRGFRETVERVLSETNMDPTALVLEITESVLIDDRGRAGRVLAELADLGIQLALDDFGTGYSSLSYLRRLPIHIVKIDQSFVADLGNPAARAIIEAVTSLAHVLGLTVIAEGVETEAQRRQVAALGCEFAQGFLFSEPMSAAALGEALRNPMLLTDRAIGEATISSATA